jgi:cyanate permease
MSHSWLAVTAFVVLGGIGHSLAQNGANAVLFAGLERRQLALAFAMKEAAIPVASLVSGLALPLIGLTVGWRWAFLIGTLLALLVFLLARQSSGTPSVRRPGDVSIRQVRLPMLILAIAGGLGSAALTSTVAFLVVSLVENGFEPSAAGFLLGFGSIVAVVTRLVAGWLGYVHGVEPLRAASVLMGLGAAGFFLLGASGEPLLTVFGTLLAFSGGWGWTGSLLAGIAQSVSDAPVTALPILQMGFSAGGVLGPLAFSAIVEFVSHGAAWAALSAAVLLAAVMVHVGQHLLVHAAPTQLRTR